MGVGAGVAVGDAPGPDDWPGRPGLPLPEAPGAAEPTGPTEAWAPELPGSWPFAPALDPAAIGCDVPLIADAISAPPPTATAATTRKASSGARFIRAEDTRSRAAAAEALGWPERDSPTLLTRRNHQRGESMPDRPAPNDESTDETPPVRRTRKRAVATSAVVPAAEGGNLPNQRIPAVAADRLELAQSSIGQATAQSISLRQGAVGRISRAERVDASMSAVGGVRAERVSVERGALGGALARDVSISQSFAQTVVALNASLRQSGARMIVANHVEMGPSSGALIVIARRVDGGRSLLDWRGALVLGAIFAAVSVAFSRRRGTPRAAKGR